MIPRALLVSFLILLSAGTARADDPYAIQGGYGDLDSEGERVRALRIPAYLGLRSWEDHPIGLRLRLAATFAVNDLEYVLDNGLEQVNMTALMAGMEMLHTFGNNHLVRPFIDIGGGTDSYSDKQVLLWAGGVRTEFIFAGSRFFYGLEPGFEWSNRAGADLEDRSNFNPFVTLSARRVLGFTIDGHQPDGGVFFEAGYDFNAFELSSVRSTRDAVSTNMEVGLGFGFSQTHPKIWFVRIPRIRIGYRFGDLEGWRLRLGGDWLTRVVGLNSPSR
jgi:hypothetical protein